jgi:hypothetical protein
MDLKDVHDFVRDILNKEMGGWFSPEQIDMYLYRSIIWHFNDLVPKYAKGQVPQDGLAPFTVKMVFTDVAGGLIEMPVGDKLNPYEHLKAVYVQYFDSVKGATAYRAIKVYNDDEIAERLNSQILRPTVTKPVAQEIVRGQVQLYPESPMSGYCLYFRTPKKPFFSYTVGADERQIIYNKGLSTQIEFGESYMGKVMIKAIQLAGVNLSDQMILQYTELKDTQNI